MHAGNALQAALNDRQYALEYARWAAHLEREWRAKLTLKYGTRYQEIDRFLGGIFWPVALGICLVGAAYRRIHRAVAPLVQRRIEGYVRRRLGADPDPLAAASLQELETELERRNALKEPTT